MPLEFQIMRQIEGIRNTMRDEFLLFFRKPEKGKLFTLIGHIIDSTSPKDFRS